ncbi:hypothetical protein Esti_004602 [Eimeria stiedai]
MLKAQKRWSDSSQLLRCTDTETAGRKSQHRGPRQQQHLQLQQTANSSSSSNSSSYSSSSSNDSNSKSSSISSSSSSSSRVAALQKHMSARGGAGGPSAAGGGDAAALTAAADSTRAGEAWGPEVYVHSEAEITGAVELGPGCCVCAAAKVEGGEGGLSVGRCVLIKEKASIKNTSAACLLYCLPTCVSSRVTSAVSCAVSSAVSRLVSHLLSPTLSLQLSLRLPPLLYPVSPTCLSSAVSSSPPLSPLQCPHLSLQVSVLLSSLVLLPSLLPGKMTIGSFCVFDVASSNKLFMCADVARGVEDVKSVGDFVRLGCRARVSDCESVGDGSSISANCCVSGGAPSVGPLEVVYGSSLRAPDPSAITVEASAAACVGPPLPSAAVGGPHWLEPPVFLALWVAVDKLQRQSMVARAAAAEPQRATRKQLFWASLLQRRRPAAGTGETRGEGTIPFEGPIAIYVFNTKSKEPILNAVRGASRALVALQEALGDVGFTVLRAAAEGGRCRGSGESEEVPRSVRCPHTSNQQQPSAAGWRLAFRIFSFFLERQQETPTPPARGPSSASLPVARRWTGAPRSAQGAPLKQLRACVALNLVLPEASPSCGLRGPPCLLGRGPRGPRALSSMPFTGSRLASSSSSNKTAAGATPAATLRLQQQQQCLAFVETRVLLGLEGLLRLPPSPQASSLRAACPLLPAAAASPLPASASRPEAACVVRAKPQVRVGRAGEGRTTGPAQLSKASLSRAPQGTHRLLCLISKGSVSCSPNKTSCVGRTSACVHRMGLQLPPSVFSYSRLLRLLLDCVVVFGLLASMLYVALDGNTWAATPLRLLPTLLGWTLFACSLFATDKVYRLYTHWLRGWPAVKQQEQPAHAGLWRRPLCLSSGQPDNLKRLTTTETLTARFVGSVMLGHAAFRESVHRLCSRPSFRMAGILWAIGFSLSWCSTLAYWRRDNWTQRWDFQSLSTRDYAIQEVFLAAATLEFSLSFTHQVEVLSFILSPVFLVEIATLPPCVVFVRLVFGRFLGDYRISHVLLLTGCLRWLKSFVYARFVSSSLMWGSHTKAQVVQLILGISLLLLTFASAMFTAEATHPFESCTHASQHAFLTFWGYLYFGVVTMSTVGYGDVHPETWIGQGLCVVFIVTSLVWVPREFAVLVDSLSSRGKIVGNLPLKLLGGAFILLVGDVSPSQLSAFIQEARLRSESPPKLVVLTAECLDSYAQQLREAQLGRVRLCFVHGEAGIGGLPGDLQLVQPSEARQALPVLVGVFVLSPPASFNVFSDRQVLTRILSLLKGGVDPTKCCVQLGTEICASVVATMGVTSYIILSDLKTGLISRSLSDCPGLIPLVTNLCSSSYPDVPSAVLRQRFSPAVLTHMEAYIRGAMHSLYSFRAPLCMLGVEFEEVVLNLFRLAGIITLGIQRRHSGPLPSPVGPHTAACTRLFPAVGKSLVSFCCCHKSHQEEASPPAAACDFACGEALSQMQSVPSSVTISPSPSGSRSKPAASAAAAAAAPVSYWLNPSGKGCVLRPGDRLVIIASSVAVAECLQYATRLPWVPRVHRMRSVISHALNVAGGGDRRSLFALRRPVGARPSLSHRCSLLPHSDSQKPTSPAHTLAAAFDSPNAFRMHAAQSGLAQANHLPTAPPSQSTAADRTTGASLVPQSPRLEQQLHEQERLGVEAGSGSGGGGPVFSREPALGQDPPRVPSFTWDDSRLPGDRLPLRQQSSLNNAACSPCVRPSQSRWADLAGKLAHRGSRAPTQMQPAQQQLAAQTSLGLQRLDPASSVAAAATPGLCFETVGTDALLPIAASRFCPRLLLMMLVLMRLPQEEDPVVPVLGSEAVDEREQQEAESLFSGGKKEARRRVERRVSDSSDEVLDHLRQADATQLLVRSAFEAYESRFVDPLRPLILVCGWPKFLRRLLRKLSLSGRHNVIVLAAETPPAWSDLSSLAPFADFAAVINGRPLNELDLLRAGLLEARCIYVFPLALDNTVFDNAASVQQHNDRNAILVYLQMRHLLVHKMDVLESAGTRVSSPGPLHAAQQPGDRSAPGLEGPFSPSQTTKQAAAALSRQGPPRQRRSPPEATRCKPPAPPPQGAGPPPSRKGFWKRHQQAAAARRGRGSSGGGKVDSSLKFKTPVLFRRFVGAELLILELQQPDNWRFISDAEWIDRDLHQAPCYSAASYLHSTAFMNGSLFCDRMLYSVITQNPALSEFSVLPAILMELVGNTLVSSGPGIQLEELPPYARTGNMTFGMLLEVMLLEEKKIPLALYRLGLDSLEHYVVTCPPKDCVLQRTDRVYVQLAGMEKMSLTPDRVVKRINAHLAATIHSRPAAS